MNKKALIAAALKVAKKYPVFPTNGKKPVWSNKELGVGKGQGGYKIATTNSDGVKKLFSHDRATEIAVPMGEMAGLICIDVDTYKHPELDDWIEDWGHCLHGTLTHRTRSGGVHFIFKHPGPGHRFPATLRDGVDLKANGTGYICWPPTEGYEVADARLPKDFPLEIVEQALKDKGGTGATRTDQSFNAASDDELIERILRADELYPALRSLSYRLPTRRNAEGNLLTRDEQLQTLRSIMDDSDARRGSHPRHDDWLDRYDKIEDLVDSAVKIQSGPQLSEEDVAAITAGDSFIPEHVAVRPIGPQRETTAEDIERRVAEQLEKTSSSTEETTASSASEFTVTSEADLHEDHLDPLEWIIPDMIPVGGIVSLGGTSNVGKTRWLAGLSAALSAGDTERLGLPRSSRPVSSLWLANEERTGDILRRLKAVARQHGSHAETPIVIRGKDAGMLRLVSLNEIGTPEIDEHNVARVVAAARDAGVSLIIFDPYVTLSDAMDENSAQSAAVLTKAFLLISNLTGAAVLHAHHTPKDRAQHLDWYRGDSGAWRGSGAIYSGLDCGFTLAHWMPDNPEQRKIWKRRYLEQQLSRWIVLDTGKIREGKPGPPIIYELVGQEMDEGEGEPIGVCRLSDKSEAVNALLDDAVDTIAAQELAEALLKTLGPGRHTKFAKIHKAMKGHQMWPAVDKLEGKHKQKLYEMFEHAIEIHGGRVWMELHPDKPTNGRWSLIIEEDE